MLEKPKLTCAIYTRKSCEEGLDQDYNSLDAQYDDGASYIQSQRQQGWVVSPVRYDDGGYSGGNLERPALKRLIADIEAGLVHIVVVYKIDRLSRSLADFAKLVEVFDKHGVTFVSVTQHFNTTTSMGRLTLNILLSFAQFEREVTGERIRDKIAASKKKGIWMGGVPPIGYDVQDRKLLINKPEATTVRFIFERYLAHGSRVRMVQELDDRCYRAKSWTTLEGKKRTGKKIDTLHLHKILTNPIYTGKIHHKGQLYEGEHEAIIPQETWDAVQAQLKSKAPRTKQLTYKTDVPFLLRGVIFDMHGVAMTPSYAKKRGKHYRYYVSTKAIRHGYSSTDLRSIPAEQIEPLVIGHLRQFFTAPEIIQLTHAKAQVQSPHITVNEVREGLQQFNEMWDQLFPLEQNRIVRLIVQRIQVSLQGVDITYQPNGIMEVYGQVTGRLLSA